MGEYATRRSDGEQVKIGTCEDMYYLRMDDVDRVSPLSGNLNPTTEPGLRFRLPYPDEDHVRPGEYDDHNRGLRLYRMVKDVGLGRDMAEDYRPEWLAEAEAGSIQLHHKPSGLLIGVKCHHGESLPDIHGATVGWNGKGHSLELFAVKRLAGGTTAPVVRCRHCSRMWSTDWSDVLPFVPGGELRDRLLRYSLKGGRP